MKSAIPCSRCKKPAACRVEYAKLDLCRDCFCRRFEQRVGLANRRFRLVRRGDRIAVGVSGGKDSGALLFSLHKLARRVGEVTLLPVLVDEGIAGYRDVAAKNAQSLCRRLGLKLNVFSFSQLFGASLDQLMAARKRIAANEGRSGLLNSCGYCGICASGAKHCGAQAAGQQACHRPQCRRYCTDFPDEPDEQPAGEGGGPFGGPRDEKSGKPVWCKGIKPLIQSGNRGALYAQFNNIAFHRGGCPYAGESSRGAVKDFLNTSEEAHPGTKLEPGEGWTWKSRACLPMKGWPRPRGPKNAPNAGSLLVAGQGLPAVRANFWGGWGFRLPGPRG